MIKMYQFLEMCKSLPLCLLFILLVQIDVQAQELTVKTMETSSMDLSASKYE